MNKIEIFDDVPGYGRVRLYTRYIGTQGKSPHLPQKGSKGSKRGRYLVLQQNPLSYKIEDCTGQLLLVRRVYPPNRPDLDIKSTTLLQRSLFALTFRDISFTASDYNAAEFKWWSRAQAVSANLADLYRTRQEAVDSITGIATRIERAARACKNKQWRLMASELGVTLKRNHKHTNPAQVWLEYQYGLGPLCADVYTICSKPFPEPVRVVKTSHHVKWDLVDNGRMGGSISNLSGIRNFSGKITCRGVVHGGGAVVAASSLGLTNPGLYLWEAAPWSFVLDWWQPIGPYIDLLGQMATIKVTDASMTATWEAIDTLSARTSEDSVAYANTNFTVVTRRKDKQRQLGIPTPAFPPIKNPLSTTHLANALSLMALNIRDIFRK